MNDYLTEEEVVKILKEAITVDMLRKWREQNNGIRFERPGCMFIRYNKCDVYNWIHENLPQ